MFMNRRNIISVKYIKIDQKKSTTQNLNFISEYNLFYPSWLVLYLFVCFWIVFWTVAAVQRPSRRLHRSWLFCFYPLTSTEHGSQPSLTTRDKELVSVLKVRTDRGDLNPRPRTPQFVTLPTLPGARHHLKSYIHYFHQEAVNVVMTIIYLNIL